MYTDYHIHCEFSDDSREKMEDQIERAIDLGLNEICFTDHVDYGIKKDWEEGDIVWSKPDGMSSDNTEPEPLANVDYPAYFEKLQRMKEIYGDRISIKEGLEFGIQTITIPRFETLYKRYEDRFDCILLSIHQIDNKEMWTQEHQKGKDQKQYNEEYYREMYDVMDAYRDYSVLAHLDLIVRYDRQGRYPFANVEDMVAQILKKAIGDGKGIEVNTSSWRYGLDDTQPSRDVLKLYRDLGGRIITFGSDAHTTKQLADHIREAMDILRDELGFREFCTYEKMKPIFHEL